jgi:cytochrome P450
MSTNALSNATQTPSPTTPCRDRPSARTPRQSKQLRRRSSQEPISIVRIWDDSTPWLVSGYAQMKQLTSDPRVSVDDTLPGFPHWNAVAAEFHRPRSVFNSDGAAHSRYRRMMTKPFTFKKVDALRLAIRQIVNEKIDAMLVGPNPADLVTALALPVPSLVISEILKVPDEDRAYFEKEAFHATAMTPTVEQKMTAARALMDYLVTLVRTVGTAVRRFAAWPSGHRHPRRARGRRRRTTWRWRGACDYAGSSHRPDGYRRSVRASCSAGRRLLFWLVVKSREGLRKPRNVVGP